MLHSGDRCLFIPIQTEFAVSELKHLKTISGSLFKIFDAFGAEKWVIYRFYSLPPV